MKIAVDGPSGSGKSTISKIFAKKHNYTYIDTGAMYRALTYHFLKNNIKNENDIVNELSKINIDFDNNIIIINGEKLDEELRTNDIDNNVSYYAKISELRKWLVSIQRNLCIKHNSIMDGRDIGTVVLVDADIKFYIDADVSIRAKRRAEQNKESYEKVLENIKKRDYEDCNREDSPLKIADDAIVINSTNMTIDEVISAMEKRVFNV